MRYWKRIDAEGKTTTVEGYSHELDVEGAIEIDKTEFDSYIASLPPPGPPPKPAIDAKIESIEARLKALEEA